MGVLRINQHSILGASRALLYELLENVQKHTENHKLKSALELAIKQNTAHFSLVNAHPDEIEEFCKATERLIKDFGEGDRAQNSNIVSAIELLSDLRDRLESIDQ